MKRSGIRDGPPDFTARHPGYACSKSSRPCRWWCWLRYSANLPTADDAKSGLTPSSGTITTSWSIRLCPTTTPRLPPSGQGHTYVFAEMAHNTASVYGVQIASTLLFPLSCFLKPNA